MYLDTKDIQKFSVQQFMSHLGYDLYNTQYGGFVFVCRNNPKSDKRILSFNTAIALHNNSWESLSDVRFCESNNPLMHIISDVYSVNMAVASKIVEKAKIQYSKKKKDFILSDENTRLVKFMCPEYEYLFLPMIKSNE